MKSFTIHGVDPIVDRKIQERSREWGLSQNKTVLRLLQEAVSSDSAAREASFRELCGAWPPEQKTEFDQATASLGTVDDRDWQR
jgi:hypothetical protein